MNKDLHQEKLNNTMDKGLERCSNSYEKYIFPQFHVMYYLMP